MYVSICVQVAAEARRGIPWSCSYRKSGATEQKFWQQNSCSLQKQQALLTTEMCLKLVLIRSKTYQKIDVYSGFFYSFETCHLLRNTFIYCSDPILLF